VAGVAPGLDRSAAQSADGAAAQRFLCAASVCWPILAFALTWHRQDIEAWLAAGFVDFSAKRGRLANSLFASGLESKKKKSVTVSSRPNCPNRQIYESPRFCALEAEEWQPTQQDFSKNTP
jgi:hypothetical protein